MAKIAAIAWKDTLLAFSSRSQLLFFIILPVVFTYILGSAFSGDQDSSRIALAVVDQDSSQLATALINQLADGGTVAPEIQTAADAQALFADEVAPAVLTIPAGFEARLLAGQPATVGLKKAPNDFNAEAADQAVERAVAALSRPLLIGQGAVAAMESAGAFPSDQARSAAFRESVTLAQGALAGSAERVRVSRPAAGGSDSDAVDFDAVDFDAVDFDAVL
jgi:ABC-2 type transport system permease protein